MWFAGLSLWVGGCVRVLDLDRPPGSDLTGDAAAEAPLCVPTEAEGSRLPSARCALTAVYASRRLDDRSDNTLRLQVEWFLASAWQTSSYQRSAYRPPFEGTDARWQGHEG